MKAANEPPRPSGTDWFSEGVHVLWLAGLVGVILIVIGIRFLVVPQEAAETFGLGRTAEGPFLHYVVGLRDLWLGGLAVAFALLRDMRALSLWLVTGSLVCFSDAVLVSAHGGPGLAIAFHCSAGVLCLLLAAGAWRRMVKT